MKIRQGFVSNSSSSSFIVEVGDVNYWEKLSNKKNVRLRYVRKITQAQEQMLLKFGFKYTHLHNPMALLSIPLDDISKFLHKTPGKKRYTGGKGYYKKIFGRDSELGDPPRRFDGMERDYLAIHVQCNEDEVASFLVVHNIPFIANTHYGHHFMQYERGAKHTISVPNLGEQVQTYGLRIVRDDEKTTGLQKSVEKQSVAEWRKERRSWQNWNRRRVLARELRKDKKDE